MHSTPRSPSTRGLSSLGTLLLAVAGGSLIVFLVFGLPRLSESRAAGARPLPDVPLDQPRAAPSAVELVPGAEATPDEPAPQAAPVAPTSMSVVAHPAMVAAESDKIAGPKLKYLKGGDGGKPETFDHREVHTAQREHRREKATLAAQGLASEDETQKVAKAKAPANPNRWRVANRSGMHAPGKGKEKKEKKKDG